MAEEIKSVPVILSVAQEAPINKMLAVFQDLMDHDGYGDFRVEVKILKRGQKEVIIHYGKQFRYVLDQNV